MVRLPVNLAAKAWRGAWFALVIVALAACAQQPQGAAYPGGSAPTQAQLDNAFLRTFGGPYADPRLQAYVASVGNKLAAQTGASDVRWRFAVADSPFPTGAATPDGSVLVTRGILSLMSDESELAAVLGHEIGHVVLHHHANRIDRQRQELAPVVQAVEHGDVTEARRLLLEGVLRIQAYSRENEFEADRYAVMLLSKAGYPPSGVDRMLTRLNDLSGYTNRGAGRLSEGMERENLLASHPAIGERVTRAQTEARPLPANNRDPVAREYLAAIDGIIVGRDTRNGVLRNGQMLHGLYGVRLNVPDGYIAIPDRQLSSVLGRDGSGFIFNCQPEQVSGSVQSWMEQRMQTTSGKGPQVEPYAVQGFDGASISVPSRFRNGVGKIKLVAVKKDESVCRFLVFVPPEVTEQSAAKLDASIRTLSRLSDAELASTRPFRMRILSANGGETLEALARSQSLPESGIDFVRLLNGVESGHRYGAGQSIKMLTRD